MYMAETINNKRILKPLRQLARKEH